MSQDYELATQIKDMPKEREALVTKLKGTLLPGILLLGTLLTGTLVMGTLLTDTLLMDLLLIFIQHKGGHRRESSPPSWDPGAC